MVINGWGEVGRGKRGYDGCDFENTTINIEWLRATWSLQIHTLVVAEKTNIVQTWFGKSNKYPTFPDDPLLTVSELSKDMLLFLTNKTIVCV